jgi:hypothetical protein
VQTETWAKVAEAGATHADADGRIRMSNLVLLAVGRA